VAVATASVMTFSHQKLRAEPVNLTATHATQLASTIKPLKPRKNCASGKEQCMDSGCCKQTGARCFKMDEKHAWCNMTCSKGKGWSCEDITATRDEVAVERPGTALYCYAVHFHDNHYKPNHELELLKMQMQRGLGIFACDAFELFSDVQLSVGDYEAVTVDDLEGDFCKYKRPDTGACANTAIFYQVWQLMRGTSAVWDKVQDKGWVIKADVDAVLIPQRLTDMLSQQGEPNMGVYYENCKGVDSGFYGNLEVVSTKGFKIVADNLEECKRNLCWGGELCEDWKWGPWGEDKFLQECMDRHGVAKLPLYELTYDGCCASDRPDGVEKIPGSEKKPQKWKPSCSDSYAPSTHPFMTVESWETCYADTMKPKPPTTSSHPPTYCTLTPSAICGNTDRLCVLDHQTCGGEERGEGFCCAAAGYFEEVPMMRGCRFCGDEQCGPCPS